MSIFRPVTSDDFLDKPLPDIGKAGVLILGSFWRLEYRSQKDDPKLEDCDGYCDWTTRIIVVEKEIEGNLGDMDAYARKVARHEIVHAFLLTCGLAESSAMAEAWAVNEEMVDWIARMGPKIYRAWKQAGVLPPEEEKTDD